MLILSNQASRFIGGGRFTPNKLVGLALWLKADAITGLADADAIATWTDSSGNGRDATQGTAGARPTYATGIINGLPVARFDGGDALLLAATLLTDDIFSVFVVVKANGIADKPIVAQHTGSVDVGRTILVGTNPANAQLTRLLFNNGTTYGCISTTAAYAGNAAIAYSQSDGAGNSHVRVNGSAAQGAITGQTWTPIDTPLSIGGIVASSSYFTGDIAEVIIYTVALSDANRQAVERYLSVKYGIALA